MSETKYSMWATILGNVVNVILNYLFIQDLDFPELGIVGAAIGTIVLVLLWFNTCIIA
jgi:MATE family multidrug resistance protein